MLLRDSGVVSVLSGPAATRVTPIESETQIM